MLAIRLDDSSYSCYLLDVTTSETSNGLLLAETTIQIRYGNRSESYPCKVYFDLKRDNSLLIEPLQPITAICSDIPPRSFWLTIPGAQKQVECYAVSFKMGNAMRVELAPCLSSIEVDRSSSLIRVNTGILNLGPHWTDKPRVPSFFKLSHDDWVFEFTPVTDATLLYLPSIQNEKYFFTHHLCVQKVDGTSFSTVEAHKQLQDLSLFFSFCYEQWISTALTTGIKEDGEVGMEEWGTRKVSPWHRPGNWLDEYNGQCMAQLFPAFMRLITNSAEWKRALETTIYWYVRADTDHVGPDGGCILLQAALERLAWHILVRERRSLSEDGFSRLPAADQLRLLLAALSIPLSLPAGLVDLQRTSKEFNWEDGPQAFVEIRNRIVHPLKTSKARKPLPYYEAFRLAKWYLELTVLSSCAYNGQYANRTREHRWVGEVEPVPWAS